MESTTAIQTTTEPSPTPGGVAKLIRKVRKVTKRRFTADQKIKIVLEGFRRRFRLPNYVGARKSVRRYTTSG